MEPSIENKLSIMKITRAFGFLYLSVLLIGCSESIKEKRENLELLRRKATALDSLIEMETQKLNSLDSMIKDEEKRVFSLDSLVMRESRRIDTLVQNLYKKIDESKPAKK